ncbi:hypothetical protein AAHC03_016449 [Spirometra sp. Aus1]
MYGMMPLLVMRRLSMTMQTTKPLRPPPLSAPTETVIPVVYQPGLCGSIWIHLQCLLPGLPRVTPSSTGPLRAPLAYSLLARLIQRLSCTPTTSPEFIHLRRLPQWLVSCVERLFPWMPAGKCIDGARDLLRQAHGSLAKVLQHLRALASSKLHELTCPRISGLLAETHSRALHRGLEAHTEVTFAIYKTCWQTVCAHLAACHPECGCPSSPHLHKMTELEAFVGLANRRRGPGATATDADLECYDPHAEEKAEEYRQETRDERWIEHWSTLEDRIAISNFQKELFLRWQRILIQQRTGATTSLSSPGATGKTTNLLDSSCLKPFHFALPEYWEALGTSYAQRMQPL